MLQHAYDDRCKSDDRYSISSLVLFIAIQWIETRGLMAYIESLSQSRTSDRICWHVFDISS